MNTVGQIHHLVSSSMKRFFCMLVKQSFWRKFGFQCPQSLHRIKDLSFLPHLIKSTVPWRHIQIPDLQDYLQLGPEQWDACLASPHSPLNSLLVHSSSLLLVPPASGQLNLMPSSSARTYSSSCPLVFYSHHLLTLCNP